VYGPWVVWPFAEPYVYDRMIKEAAPLIREFVADARLRERIAKLPAFDAADRSRRNG
jgi:hypothetical protein